MSDFDDHLIDRELNELLGGDGPSPDLKQRVLAAVGAVPARRHTGRVLPLPRKRTPWGAYAAAAAAMVLAVGATIFALTREQPQKQPDTADQTAPTKPGLDGSSPGDKPVPADEPKAPGGEPGPAGPGPTPQPAPGREPDAPEQQPGPGKHDEPETPAPETPKPEQPAPEPKREEVEQPRPEPKQPEPTTPGEAPNKRAVVATVVGEGKLKFREREEDKWLTLEGEVHEGWQLQATKPASVRLADGALLRFEGELSITPAAVEIHSRRAELWLDCLGCETQYRVRAGVLDASITDAAALFEHNNSRLAISVFEGAVAAGGGSVASGQHARLSARGLSAPVVLTSAQRASALIKDMPARVLFAQHFEAPLPAGDARIDNGIARTEGENSHVALDLPKDMKALPGSVLRVRFKVTGANNLYLQLISVSGSEQYGLWRPVGKRGEWLEWEISFSELTRDDGHAQGPLEAGRPLTGFKVFVQDGKQAVLEFDYIEIVRVQK